MICLCANIFIGYQTQLPEIVASFIAQLLPLLTQSGQRACIAMHVAEGEIPGLDVLAGGVLANELLVLSNTIDDATEVRQARHYLGHEYSRVIFDARDGINVDALGAISGVIKGGGILLLLLPELNAWQSTPSRYNRYVMRLLDRQPGIYHFTSQETIPVLPDKNKRSKEPCHCDAPYLSSDQQLAVETLQRDIRQHDRYCAVLTSGRGRGKTVSLGLLAAELGRDAACKLIITAPRKSVVQPVFQQVQAQFSGAEQASAAIRYNGSRLEFYAPDALLEQLPEADVLLVDEAAVIPVPMLKQLLLHYPRIVFCTTTHGYEGTGRGFILKFYRLLDEQRPGWKKIHMHQPIRWARHDPLERWIESLLFLDVRLPATIEVPADVAQCGFRLLDRDELVNDRALLSSVLSLLVFAHYRTSPSDFQYLLDSQDVRLYILEYQSKVVAVLLVNQEGSMTPELSSAIYRGERRPQGHLLAQTLCFHAGDETAATLRFARVMRLAVHPSLQRKGLGSQLLQRVIEAESAREMDVIGSSFSATGELLHFWQKAGMTLLRIGFTRDHVTASNPAVVGCGLTPGGQALIHRLATKFERNFDLWHKGPLQQLSEPAAERIRSSIRVSTESPEEDRVDLVSFACYHRNFEACMPAIVRWLERLGELPAELAVSDQKIINASVRFFGDWKKIVVASGLSGKGEAEKKLRLALRRLLDLCEQD